MDIPASRQMSLGLFRGPPWTTAVTIWAGLTSPALLTSNLWATWPLVLQPTLHNFNPDFPVVVHKILSELFLPVKGQASGRLVSWWPDWKKLYIHGEIVNVNNNCIFINNSLNHCVLHKKCNLKSSWSQEVEGGRAFHPDLLCGSKSMFSSIQNQFKKRKCRG